MSLKAFWCRLTAIVIVENHKKKMNLPPFCGTCISALLEASPICSYTQACALHLLVAHPQWQTNSRGERVCVCIFMCVYVCTYIYIYMCVCVCVCMYVCMYVCMCMYMCMCICMYMYIYLNIYIYIYISYVHSLFIYI